ncbi:hypothetical protein [Actinomadura harenae]|uniref:hypothetical protein n=1 Tax=Actinomadura harenae TaxID=2483351 RepID=UPI001F2ECA9E|nr:hypothetical protein [Actinomadura harenae]
MLLLAQIGTQVLLMPVSGVAADRIPRRILLVGSLVAFGAIGAAQTALAATRTATVAALAASGRSPSRCPRSSSPPKKASSAHW